MATSILILKLKKKNGQTNKRNKLGIEQSFGYFGNHEKKMYRYTTVADLS